jgi:NADH-quinone oxidoreductase subunit M
MSVLFFLLWPLVSGTVLFFLNRFDKVAKYSNVLFQGVWLALFFQVWADLPTFGSGPFPVAFKWEWLPFLKSRFALGVDGLNLPLIALNVILSLCLALYSIGNKKLNGVYLGLFSILNFASVGSLLATDIFAFYCFWEFMLIPMLFLIGKWGSQNRIYAALKFFAFTMAGSLPLLAAILSLSFGMDVPALGWHELVAENFNFEGWSSVQALLFLGFLAAFAVKIPVWPVHVWLPDAHTEAPTGASVILAGVLLKLGVYGIARWCLPLFPEASAAAAPTLMVLGVIGIVLGAFGAWWQTDIKKMIAYSSVSHLGFMVLGLFAMNAEGLQGAMFQNLAHGLSTGAMFLIFGIVYDRTHTREIKNYGGLGSHNPWLATAFVFSAMASVALPGLPGFVGEFLILTGTYFESPLFTLIALSGVVLGAVYTLNLLRGFIYGVEGSAFVEHPVKRIKWFEWAAIFPLLAFMLYLGLGPNEVLKFSQNAVDQVILALR